MNVRRNLGLGLVLVMCFALMVPASAAQAGPPYETKRETHIVPTRHGDISIEIARPVIGDKDVKGPVILTYSPYSVLGRSANRAKVAEGYVVAFADVVGTGNSGGCYDYGGKREKETGYDIIEWLGTRRWSTGKVGMIGASYNGTTATAAATQRPPHLTTIVPEAAISRWYEYAYSGGIRYFLNNENPTDEGFDTPIAFDFGFAIPPPINAQDPKYAERVSSTVRPCDEIQHTERGYDETPVYDEFWLERDYIKSAHKIDIPVLVSHNWGDWNVKQEEAFNLYRALENSPKKVLYMGNRFSGHGRPSGEYVNTVAAWFDHYLMGKDNGIENLPRVISEKSNFDGPTKWYSGRWPDITKTTLFAQHSVAGDPDYDWKLLPSRPQEGGEAPTAEFVSTNANSEVVANEERRSNDSWFWFETPPLARDVRIFGRPKVRVFSTVQREWLTLTPTVVDVTPGGAAFSATRGWLDSRYTKNGRAERGPITPGESFGMKIVEKPQDYTFEKGHRIGLNISTEIIEWNVPKPFPCTTPGCETVQIDWKKGQTRLTLPVVNGPRQAGRLFQKTARLPGPRVALQASDETPKRGDTITFNSKLRRCEGHAGTEMVLKRKVAGTFKQVAKKSTDNRCRARFRIQAAFGRAKFKAVWPKQHGGHRRGRSSVHEVRTH